MQVYERACKAVPQEQRLPVYEVYVKKAQEFFGVAKVREVYESAIEAPEAEALSNKDTRELCLRYAMLEKKLGEVDRARAILVHASQFADPRTDKAFWTEWNQFEVQHGNEDTFREMLRIKRSVGASYSMMHVPGPGSALGGKADAAPAEAAGAPAEPTTLAGAAESLKRKRDDPMASLEAEAAPAAATGTRLVGFVSAGTYNPNQGKGEGAGPEGGKAAPAPVRNAEEIDLGDEEEEEGAGGFALEEKAVPAAVLGSVADQAQGKRQRRGIGAD